MHSSSSQHIILYFNGANKYGMTIIFFLAGSWFTELVACEGERHIFLTELSLVMAFVTHWGGSCCETGMPVIISLPKLPNYTEERKLDLEDDHLIYF